MLKRIFLAAALAVSFTASFGLGNRPAEAPIDDACPWGPPMCDGSGNGSLL